MAPFYTLFLMSNVEYLPLPLCILLRMRSWVRMPNLAALNEPNNYIRLMHLVGHIFISNAYQPGAFIHSQGHKLEVYLLRTQRWNVVDNSSKDR